MGHVVHSGGRRGAGRLVRRAPGHRPALLLRRGHPGTVLQDTLSVRNPTDRVLDVRLSGGSWVTLAAPEVDVPARTRADVPFTVRIPDGTPPGDRTATITARASGRTETVRVRLRVGGPRLPALTVEHVRVRGDRIAYELVNRGTTDLTPTLTVRADGVLGPSSTGPHALSPYACPRAGASP